MIDLQNYYNDTKRSTVPTKPILGYHHTLSMLLHYLAKLKSQKFALLMHLKHVSNVTVYHISNRQKMPNVMKISAKINIMQNINIFLLSLSLTTLQLSKVGLLTIKHQHSKKADRMDRSQLNQKHMKNANCLQAFVHKRCSKRPPFAWTHPGRRFLHW